MCVCVCVEGGVCGGGGGGLVCGMVEGVMVMQSIDLEATRNV